MKNGLYSILVLALFTLSCSEQQYFVKGKSTQSTIDGEYAYMGPMNSLQVLYFDSCRVVHGKFEMTGPLDSVLCVTIYMGSMRIPMVLEDGEVSINEGEELTGIDFFPALPDAMEERIEGTVGRFR